MSLESVSFPPTLDGIKGLNRQNVSEVERNSLAVARKFITHFEAKEVTKAYSMIGYRGRFTLIGQTPLSGTFVGWDQFLARMSSILTQPFEISTTRFHEVIVDEDRLVMLGSGEGAALNGRKYVQSHYAFIARVAGDGFSELLELCDTAMIEWGYFGKVLVDSKSD